MVEVLVFGGTSEGRQLVEWLSGQGSFSVVVCSATEYGGELVGGLERVESLVGPLDNDAKQQVVAVHDFACIVDATHPYATHVTESIAALSSQSDLPLYRLVRDEGADDGAYTEADDIDDAARIVAQREGNILLTTGTKDLGTFVNAVPDFAERLYARILPVGDSVSHARELGIPASHIVAMQGPFSTELNCAIMNELAISTMVTKASGSAGGFDEKLEAARICGVEAVVIGRPIEEEGYSLEEVKRELLAISGSTDSSGDEATHAQSDRMRVSLVGIGLGNPDTLTVGAAKAIETSELLIGAPRLLEAFSHVDCEKKALIRSTDIAEALRASHARHASVLFSGDVGFYSGATGLADKLDGFEVESIPGISSVVYFCAKLFTPWQDAYLTSAHGRECDYVAAVRDHEKTFLLTGGKTKVRDICEALVEEGLGAVRVAVGERLSYDDELIVKGTAEELKGRDFHDLAVMLVINNGTRTRSLFHLEQGPGPCSNEYRAPRMLVAAPASGGGKTTFTCGLMQAFVNRGLKVQACKCGPDYIDPMFHREVIGAASHNLDLFFQSEEQVRQTIAQGAQSCDITVVEGVMGYYDGIAVSSDASAWQVANATQTPVVLVVDGRGRARSIAAEVFGFTRFRDSSCIAGVVLNRVSAALYPRLKEIIEEETGVSVLGYVPKLDDCSLESRHLGLITASEVEGLREKLGLIAETLEKTVEIDKLVELASSAPSLECPEVELPDAVEGSPVIAVAYDDAFCFYYDDTLGMLEKLGARLVRFSPLADAQLPEGAAGLYLGGGYPELHARELSENTTMIAAVRAALDAGMPLVAECGGFMYLHEELEDDQGAFWPLVGAIRGRSFRTPRLSRFGYVTLEANGDGLLCAAGESLRAHEFHYWDSDDPGDAFCAQKPQSTRSWKCAHVSATRYAGYPHLCLHAQPEAAARFVRHCAAFAQEREVR